MSAAERELWPLRVAARPVEREEDVAGPLDLVKQLEAGSDVPLGVVAAQRMIQERERITNPRLVRAVLDAGEACEEHVADRRVRR